MPQLFSSNWSLRGETNTKCEVEGIWNKNIKGDTPSKNYYYTHTHTHRDKEETISWSVEASPVPTEPSHFPRDHAHHHRQETSVSQLLGDPQYQKSQRARLNQSCMSSQKVQLPSTKSNTQVNLNTTLWQTIAHTETKHSKKNLFHTKKYRHTFWLRFLKVEIFFTLDLISFGKSNCNTTPIRLLEKCTVHIIPV
jgi:hypothetical protein